MKGNRILVISPQAWGGRFVSKHHYALTLAKMGNEVYFLGPPEERRTNLEIERLPENKINLIKHSLHFDGRIRFHFRFLFDFLMKKHVKSINSKLGSFDIVWCFEPNLYSSLFWFKGKVRIYHPVDVISESFQIQIGKTANLILSVDNNILQKFDHIKVPRYFLNHGLSSEFMNLRNAADLARNKVKFAYIGNLCIKGLDRYQLKEVILKYPKIEFDFYGNTDCIEGSEEAEFLDFLKSSSNANLKGIKEPKELAIALSDYDGFLLCYNPSKESNAGSNSHKILEYLSFGKVVVSNRVEMYQDKSDLLVMSERKDNSDYFELFSTVVSKLDFYNRVEIQQKRIDFAKSNSYVNQIQKVNSFIIEI